ncbi:hypothetical protein HNR00_000320 [Methylorubrum rhodinum]|jgi:hypothetical protein|uniref:Uncharacterized protein n=1 Tax=Methylorubrum rhodinum TaxID=29428 RepID=A0A840ZF16_9HYPH|nr:hypothetical protein [Methylorubrum rhodinum]MBB5755631.1 hypothetical protein [Methylorubrum rhodinum]
MSLTVQLALGVGLFMLGSSVFLWRITAAFDRDHARRPGAPTKP